VTGRKSGLEVSQASQSVSKRVSGRTRTRVQWRIARARISETVCIFRPAIVAWSILVSDRWYLYFCAATVVWLILFNVERRVVLRRSRCGLLVLRPIVHILTTTLHIDR